MIFVLKFTIRKIILTFVKERVQVSRVKKYLQYICCLSVLILSACSSASSDQYPTEYPQSQAISKAEVKFPEFPHQKTLKAQGTAVIDYSHASQGYIGAKLFEDNKKVKIRVEKDGKQYHHDLINKNEWTTFPLQMGNGTYELVILKNIEGNKYARVAQKQIQVTLENEFLPFLYPNQVVDYDKDSQVVDLSFSLTKENHNDLERLKTLYEYVIDCLDYDNSKAKNVSNVYVLPDLDKAIEEGKGICFDYASLLAALCRVQGFPARVITGETEIEYHAWVEVYLEGKGWINPKYEFQEKSWTMVDPTFDDSGSDYEGAYVEVFRY